MFIIGSVLLHAVLPEEQTNLHGNKGALGHMAHVAQRRHDREVLDRRVQEESAKIAAEKGTAAPSADAKDPTAKS